MIMIGCVYIEIHVNIMYFLLIFHFFLFVNCNNYICLILYVFRSFLVVLLFFLIQFLIRSRLIRSVVRSAMHVNIFRLGLHTLFDNCASSGCKRIVGYMTCGAIAYAVGINLCQSTRFILEKYKFSKSKYKSSDKNYIRGFSKFFSPFFTYK